jgi:hypothetical protein
MDSIPDLELLSLDPDEEEVLSKSKAVSELTQAQLDAFNEWVGPNNPSRLEAKHWITGANNLDLNVFSSSEIYLLIKRAKCIYDNQTHHEV